MAAGNFDAVSFGGGIGGFDVDIVALSGGFYNYGGQRRTKEDIRKDRQRFGVIPPDAVKIIEDVATRQAESLKLNEQQRLEELTGELKLAGIEYRSAYLALLNQERERMIDAEIGRRIRESEDEKEIQIILLLAVL